MVYPILLISTIADCESLIKEVNVDKGRLALRLAAMQQQRIAEELDETDPVKLRQRALDEIAVYEKHLEDEMSSADRADLELKILRTQLRVKTFDRQIKNNGPVAQNMDVLETARLEAEIKVIDDFLTEVEAHRENLAKSSPEADADVGDAA